MERTFKSGHETPKNQQIDDGTEFFKASIVDCFNRTLKELMWREFSLLANKSG